MTLPTKPDAVAHVSDAHWEAALRQAWNIFASKRPHTIAFERADWGAAEITPTIIDHARCLILLNEVPEPVDPLEVAMDALWDSWNGGWSKSDMKDSVCKHLAGMTIPEATQ